MRYIFTILLISALAFLVACQSSAAPKSVKKIEETETKAPVTKKDDHDGHDHGEKAARISLEDAKKAYDSGEAVFIDTRSTSAFENEHVKGAINIPASDFENKYKSVPKNKKIIAYCS